MKKTRIKDVRELLQEIEEKELLEQWPNEVEQEPLPYNPPSISRTLFLVMVYLGLCALQLWAIHLLTK